MTRTKEVRGSQKVSILKFCPTANGLAAIRTQTGVALTPDEQAEVDAVEQQCRDALSPDAIARARDEGTAFDANAAADWALQIWGRPT